MMRVRAILSAFCGAAALVVGSSANANLSIDKLWVDFADGRAGRSDVVIRNDSDERYFVDVTVAEILNPGTEQEERSVVADPEALGLLVTPNRMVLEPGALRSIRLVSLNENLPKDRIYRVLVKPQVGAIERDGPPVESGSAIVMKLMAAYDVLVVARPQAARAEIVARRTDAQIELSNVGNSNVLMLGGFVCPRETPADDRREVCNSVPNVRLYAGNTIKYDIASASDVLYVKTQSFAGSSTEDRQY